MRTEDFENATEMELRQKANECFNTLHDSGSHEKPALLIEAQFYMDEIERRKQDKVAKRDFKMELLAICLEILVILLIVLELVEGGQQSKALDAAASSAKATAASVSSLQKEQEDTLRIQTEILHAIENLNATLRTKPKPVRQKAAANR
jgi:ABC-type transport system involved in cytochrome bd biosynthesis fused ATPase/permease subunit